MKLIVQNWLTYYSIGIIDGNKLREIICKDKEELHSALKVLGVKHE